MIIWIYCTSYRCSNSGFFFVSYLWKMYFIYFSFLFFLIFSIIRVFLINELKKRGNYTVLTQSNKLKMYYNNISK